MAWEFLSLLPLQQQQPCAMLTPSFVAMNQGPASHCPTSATLKMTVGTTVMRSIVVRTAKPLTVWAPACVLNFQHGYPIHCTYSLWYFQTIYSTSSRKCCPWLWNCLLNLFSHSSHLRRAFSGCLHHMRLGGWLLWDGPLWNSLPKCVLTAPLLASVKKGLNGLWTAYEV